MVRVERLELSHPKGYSDLNATCLPIPAHTQILEPTTRFELVTD